MKKDNKIIIGLALTVIVIIAVIVFIKNYNSDTLNEELARCIASKSIMYSQLGCSHCIEQKKLFGDYTSIFDIVECDEEPQKCADAGISGTPTWIINNQKIVGVRTIKQLKELSGC